LKTRSACTTFISANGSLVVEVQSLERMHVLAPSGLAGYPSGLSYADVLNTNTSSRSPHPRNAFKLPSNDLAQHKLLNHLVLTFCPQLVIKVNSSLTAMILHQPASHCALGWLDAHLPDCHDPPGAIRCKGLDIDGNTWNVSMTVRKNEKSF